MLTFARLLRVPQWIKNLLLFFPMIFSENLTDSEMLGRTGLGFVAFCMMASCIYIINDYRDIDHDRVHPTKKTRPLASGLVSERTAARLAVSLGVVSLLVAVIVGREFAGILLVYLLINLAYSFKLKEIALVDISIVAAGYLLRIFAGGVIGSILISHWMILVTFLLALFLALAKRRDDILLQKNQNVTARAAISGYNLEFSNVALTLAGSVLVVAYIMYTTSPEVTQRIGSNLLYLTSLPVIIGILRYFQLMMVSERSSDPFDVLVRDSFIQIIVLLWLIATVWIIYG